MPCIFLFLAPIPIKASNISYKANKNNSLNILIKESEENIERPNIIETPDLCDEESFPFLLDLVKIEANISL